MTKLSFEEVDEKCEEFTKWVWNNYFNIEDVPTILQHYFKEIEGVTCGFVFGLGNNEWGKITCFFIKDGEARGMLKSGNYQHNDNVTLSQFIYDNFNPKGLYVLERVMFDQT